MDLAGLALVLSVFLNAGAAAGLVFKVKDRVVVPIENKLDKIQHSVQLIAENQEKLIDRVDYIESYLIRSNRRYTSFRNRV